MPRSPAEGAATRAATELEVSSTKPTRDRRVRSGVDRRNNDHGPPHGIERRRTDRRSHDRRHAARVDRRNRSRRVPGERRGARPLKHAHLVQRQILAREPAPSTQMPRLLRAIIITVVAVACLLAATLTGDVSRAGATTLNAGPVAGSLITNAAGVSTTRADERPTAPDLVGLSSTSAPVQ